VHGVGLVFLYFANAHDVSGPCSREEWQPEIDRAHDALQLGAGPLSPFVLSVFVDSERVGAAV
jgi:hypothetical protein